MSCKKEWMEERMIEKLRYTVCVLRGVITLNPLTWKIW